MAAATWAATAKDDKQGKKGRSGERPDGPGGTPLAVKLKALMSLTQHVEDRQVSIQKQIEGMKQENRSGEQRIMKSMQCWEVRQMHRYKQEDGMLKAKTEALEEVLTNEIRTLQEYMKSSASSEGAKETNNTKEYVDSASSPVSGSSAGHDVHSARPEGYPSDSLRQLESISEKPKTLEMAMKYRHHEEREHAGIRMSDLEKKIKNGHDMTHMVSPGGYPSGCFVLPMGGVTTEMSNKKEFVCSASASVSGDPVCTMFAVLGLRGTPPTI
jgi:hypothetical protein